MNVMQQLLLMNVESLLKDFAAYRTFHKSDAVINMRIPSEVLDKIKAIAEAQGEFAIIQDADLENDP